MENLVWLIYLAGIADKVSFGFVIVAVVSTIVSIGVTIAKSPPTTIRPGELNNWLYGSIAVAVFSLLLATVTPPERTVYMMAGAVVAKEAIETETFKKVTVLVNAKLDSLIDEQLDDKSKKMTK